MVRLSLLPVHIVLKPTTVFPLHKNSGCVTVPRVDTAQIALESPSWIFDETIGYCRWW